MCRRGIGLWGAALVVAALSGGCTDDGRAPGYTQREPDSAEIVLRAARASDVTASFCQLYADGVQVAQVSLVPANGRIFGVLRVFAESGRFQHMFVTFAPDGQAREATPDEAAELARTVAGSRDVEWKVVAVRGASGGGLLAPPARPESR